MTINNINDFSAYLGIEVDDLEKVIYDGTYCGAWINWDEKEIRIGSIVEGSDAEFECDPLVFPFDSEDFEQALIWLEAETDREWRECNDEYENDDDDYRRTPSSTAGDYGPSNPWDAPGMSISDFI